MRPAARSSWRFSRCATSAFPWNPSANHLGPRPRRRFRRKPSLAQTRRSASITIASCRTIGPRRSCLSARGRLIARRFASLEDPAMHARKLTLYIGAFFIAVTFGTGAGTAAAAGPGAGVWTPLKNWAPDFAGTMLLLSDGTVMVQGYFLGNDWMRLTP